MEESAVFKVSCPKCVTQTLMSNEACPRCGWSPRVASQSDDEDITIVEDVEHPLEELPPDPPEMVPGPGFENLEELNVGQLRPMARDLKVKGWSGMKKAALIKAIKKATRKK